MDLGEKSPGLYSVTLGVTCSGISLFKHIFVVIFGKIATDSSYCHHKLTNKHEFPRAGSALTR